MAQFALNPDNIVAKYIVHAQKDVAAFFGVHPKTIDVWRRSGMPGEQRNWDLAEIAQWRESHIKKKSGENSQYVELWQKERFLSTRLKRRQAENDLVERAYVHEELQRLAGLLRQLGERLQKSFGQDAQDILDEAVDSFAKRVKSKIEEVSVFIDEVIDEEAKDEE